MIRLHTITRPQAEPQTGTRAGLGGGGGSEAMEQAAVALTRLLRAAQHRQSSIRTIVA